MAILYAPTIDTPLPSFFVDNNELILSVPIVNNKFVYKGQYTKFALLIKNNNTGSIIGDPIFSQNANTATFVFPERYFKDESALLKVGNYYKVQIAYATETEVGVYSSATVIKYTAKPEVVGTLTNGLITFQYTNADPSERIDTYSISIYDNNQQLLYDTGVLVHKRDSDKVEGTSLDDYLLTSFDSFTIPGDLSVNDIYHYKYNYSTINAYMGTCDFFGAGDAKVYSQFLDSGFVTLKAQQDSENACVHILLQNSGAPVDVVAGAYVISKIKLDKTTSTDYTNSLKWEYVTNIIFSQALTGTCTVARDYCVENGYAYIYAIQQYNKYGVTSERHYSNAVTIRFDYSYLLDSTRQLKINFNPKVSSFKNDLLESKMDTIGNKYPYIFRNAVVQYKEFPISGLLSKRSDKDNLFTDISFYTDNEKRMVTSNTIDSIVDEDEVAVEQKYKTEVLEWLNNGQPKLFKSPTEGNFIVRLLNVSLSPNDTLGRMLHTFNATAYEIATYNNDNLLKYHILSDMRDLFITKYHIQQTGSGLLNSIKQRPLQLAGTNIGLHIQGFNPSAINKAQINLQYQDGTIETLTVGSSGQLIIHPGEYDIKQLQLQVTGSDIQGSYDYFYNEEKMISFNRYQRAIVDPAVVIREDINDNNDYIDIIPLLAEVNIETIRNIYSISHLQFIRRYPIGTNVEKNYTVKLKFAEDKDYRFITLDDAYEYQMDNLQKITSLLIPNGIVSIICYKMVTIYTVEE